MLAVQEAAFVLGPLLNALCLQPPNPLLPEPSARQELVYIAMQAIQDQSKPNISS